MRSALCLCHGRPWCENEPDQPHGHLVEDGWRESSTRQLHVGIEHGLLDQLTRLEEQRLRDRQV